MTKKLTISGETFDVLTPYTDGQAEVGDIERKVLDQTRAENVGNNLREAIKEMQGRSASFAEMQEEVSKYDTEYNFSMGRGPREPVDPLERELYKVVREAVKGHLAETGRKVKDIDKAVLEAEYDRLVEAAQAGEEPDVMARAKKNLKDREKKVKVSSIGLGLSAPAQ
jgi:hypothetical protein